MDLICFLLDLVLPLLDLFLLAYFWISCTLGFLFLLELWIILFVFGVMPQKGSRRGRSVAQMQKLLEARSRSASMTPALSEAGDNGVEGEGDNLFGPSQSIQGEESLKGAEQQRWADLTEAD